MLKLLEWETSTPMKEKWPRGRSKGAEAGKRKDGAGAGAGGEAQRLRSHAAH